MARSARPWFARGWWRVWFNGQRVKLAQGRENKKAAQKRFLELQLVAAANPDRSAPQTVASVIEAYQEFSNDRLAASTLAIRRPYLQSFAEAHGFRKIADVGPEHMEQWVAEHPEWKSDWTKSGAIRNVQVAFNWASKGPPKRRLIPESPFRGMSHRPGLPRRPITAAEFQALLRASATNGKRKKLTPGARFRQFLIFLWFTGCRPCEASKLRWSDVDLENSVIVLHEHKTSATQRVPKPRVIPLHPVVVKLLISIRKRDEGERVFLNNLGNPWNKNNLALRMKRARRIGGISKDAKLYGARHAFGTRAIVNGVDLKTLAELLGHTTTRMSEHYVHLATAHPHLAAAMRLANVPRRGA